MPELPEVETARRGITPHILNQTISRVTVRQPKLRYPVPRTLSNTLAGHKLNAIERRSKYLILAINNGHLIIHLGMSGSLRIVRPGTPPSPHDHIDIEFKNGKILRFRDPRRFGCFLWTTKPVTQHKLIKVLGPEPLSDDFNADYFFDITRKRQVAIKQLIMNSHIVVGVGNIYANEALFLAGINPQRKAGRIGRERIEKLTSAIKQVLTRAIEQGGTTLRDFTNEDGNPGYFQQTLNVYGRAGLACPQCGQAIRHIQQGQRSTYYCTHCQS